ncbi:hypothetical protein DBR00_10725 [Pseudomonas sp. HMWF032]|nr:hypothetical protein DBR00_10725 [Pseudomonas sp. HMWF032]PTT79175.1 hypothetical protein DBR41_22130 [Pseudomonas sp. HMWF010]
MPTILRSSTYIGSQQDYLAISQYFSMLDWPSSVHTVYISNGWHTGFESRIFIDPQTGQCVTRGTTVTYCGYYANSDNGAKIHFYAN